MGQSEAYYKLIPSLNMKFSTVKSVFVPTDKRELRSKFLKKIDDNQHTFDKVAFSVPGRDGLFIEKADLIQKFIRRPGPKNEYTEYNKEKDPDLEDLCTIHFAKMFETSQRNEFDENIDALDPERFELDEDDIKFHCILRADPSKEPTMLPDYIKLLPKYLGENNIMKKRKFPEAARFNKKRQDVDPHKFFLSELILYYPFRDEKKDLHSDNEELCAKLYIKEFENIRRVKAQVM